MALRSPHRLQGLKPTMMRRPSGIITRSISRRIACGSSANSSTCGSSARSIDCVAIGSSWHLARRSARRPRGPRSCGARCGSRAAGRARASPSCSAWKPKMSGVTSSRYARSFSSRYCPRGVANHSCERVGRHGPILIDSDPRCRSTPCPRSRTTTSGSSRTAARPRSSIRAMPRPSSASSRSAGWRSRRHPRDPPPRATTSAGCTSSPQRWKCPVFGPAGEAIARAHPALREGDRIVVPGLGRAPCRARRPRPHRRPHRATSATAWPSSATRCSPAAAGGSSRARPAQMSASLGKIARAAGRHARLLRARVHARQHHASPRPSSPATRSSTARKARESAKRARGEPTRALDHRRRARDQSVPALHRARGHRLRRAPCRAASSPAPSKSSPRSAHGRTRF